MSEQFLVDMRYILLAVAVSLTACSTESWQRFLYTQSTQSCSEIVDSEARRRCMSSPDKSYDTYKAERDTLKAGGVVPPRTNPAPP